MQIKLSNVNQHWALPLSCKVAPSTSEWLFTLPTGVPFNWEWLASDSSAKFVRALKMSNTKFFVLESTEEAWFINLVKVLNIFFGKLCIDVTSKLRSKEELQQWACTILQIELLSNEGNWHLDTESSFSRNSASTCNEEQLVWWACNRCLKNIKGQVKQPRYEKLKL